MRAWPRDPWAAWAWARATGGVPASTVWAAAHGGVAKSTKAPRARRARRAQRWPGKIGRSACSNSVHRTRADVKSSANSSASAFSLVHNAPRGSLRTRGRQGQARAAARRADAPFQPGRVRGTRTSAGARPLVAACHRQPDALVADSVGAARHGEDHAGPHPGRGDQGWLRRAVRGDGRREGGARGRGRGGAAAQPARRTNPALHR
jgi:hypothetical protein